jgi:hypothetical protein
MSCFDCGFNHRECYWTKETEFGSGTCLRRKKSSGNPRMHNKKWFQHFSMCEDKLQTCRSNHLDLTHKIEGSNFADALNLGEEAYFTMEPEM